MQSLSINFGAMCPPIREQFAEQQLAAKSEDVAFWQRLADAIALLSIHDLITDAARQRARKRLLKAMCRRLQSAASVDERDLVDEMTDAEVNETDCSRCLEPVDADAVRHCLACDQDGLCDECFNNHGCDPMEAEDGKV